MSDNPGDIFRNLGKTAGQWFEQQAEQLAHVAEGFFSDLPTDTPPKATKAEPKPMPLGMETPEVHYEKAQVAFSDAEDKRSAGKPAPEVQLKMSEGVGQACLGILSALVRNGRP